MACTERCLTGLLAALVVFMVAAALRLPVETSVARAVLDLPAPLPRPAAVPEEQPTAVFQVPAAVALAEPLDVTAVEVVELQPLAFHTSAVEMMAAEPAVLEVAASDAVILEPVSLDSAELAITPEALTATMLAAALESVPLEPGSVATALPSPVTGAHKSNGGIAAGLSSRPSARLLSEAFDSIGYDLKSIGDGDRVPRLFMTNVPADMESIREVQMRKTVFLKTVLPLILQVNEEIAQERQLLWRLYYKTRLGVHLRAAEHLWLRTMAERYGVEDGDVDVLLRKIDIIPPSLALAQAAEESGWGTSRLAREGNALFGEGIYFDGKVQQIRAFDSLLDAVRGYARNLNAHGAYRDFRTARRAMRQRGTPLDGHVLAGFILRYSERGEGYVKTLRVIISANDLGELDSASLHDDLTVDVEPAI